VRQLLGGTGAACRRSTMPPDRRLISTGTRCVVPEDPRYARTMPSHGDEPSLPLARTQLGIIGGAAGDALGRTFGESQLALVDLLDAPFFLPVGGRTKDRPVSNGLPDLFRLAALRERKRDLRGDGWGVSAGIAPKRGSEPCPHRPPFGAVRPAERERDIPVHARASRLPARPVPGEQW